MSLFWFKKIVSPFFLPIPLCLEIMVGGLILLWWTRRDRLGKILVTGGIGLLVFFGYGNLYNPFLVDLESRYTPLLLSPTPSSSAFAHPPTGIRWIVVLSGGARPDSTLPVTDQISDSSLERLVEGLVLHAQFPTSTLLLSGGLTYDSIPESRVMGELAIALGFPPEQLYLETESASTKDHPLHIRRIIGHDPFILVTSASHMPRAVAMFEHQHLHPIPAPTGFTMRHHNRLEPEHFFPSATGIRKWEIASHEILGQWWAWMRNQL